MLLYYRSTPGIPVYGIPGIAEYSCVGLYGKPCVYHMYAILLLYTWYTVAHAGTAVVEEGAVASSALYKNCLASLFSSVYGLA